MNRTLALIAVVVVAVAAQPSAAEAQLRFGPQIGFANDFELGLGARAEMSFTELFGVDEGFFADVFGIASADYYFDCGFDGCSVFELTANAAYAFDIEGSAVPYAGTGLSFQRASYDSFGSDTELALNLLGGVKFALGGTTAFVEGRIQPNGYEQFILQFGVLFGAGN